MSTFIQPTVDGQPVAPAGYGTTMPDTRREIGARIRALLDASGKSFSEVARQSGIAAADLSSITRGNASVTGEQLERLLPVLTTTRDALAKGLSAEALGFLDRTFSQIAEPTAAATDAAEAAGESGATTDHPRPDPAGISEGDNVRQMVSSRQPDRARARRGNAPEAISDSDAQTTRWGEPTFPGELTLVSFKQCLGRDFKRTDSYRQEISFGYSSPCQIEVRVWTTVDSSTGRARPLGSDAIRVVVFDRLAGRKIEPWSSVLNRVGDCLDRLEAVVGHAVLRAKKRPSCSKCGSQMRICGKPEDQFWGCPNYYSSTRCTGARNLSLSGQQPSTPRRITATAMPKTS